MIDSTTKPAPPRPATEAFTLVEVLVVLALMSILAGMVVTAVQGVTTSARIARTRSIIATVDSVIQEHYESFKYRPFAVVTPTGGFENAAGVFTFEILPSEAARVRLIMTRDLQRMELPDRVSDVRQPTNQPLTHRAAATSPTVIRAMADRVIERPDGTLVLQRRDDAGDLSSRSQTNVEWYAGGQRPSRFDAYLRRTGVSWTAEHQGAECLYLILATTFSGGVAAIESIPASNIGDTDGDGVPEILDGWGRPLGFIRWPVGFADPEVDASVLDEFDPFRSDFGYRTDTSFPTSLSVPVQRRSSFAVRPLIISAGPSGEFGIAFSPRQSNTSDEDRDLSEAQIVAEEVNYATQVWPVSLQWMGAEMGGRNTNIPYYFPDPFLRQYIASSGGALLPGAGLGGTRAQSYRADNISNFQLEATE